jgi:Curlin associated repeat
MVEKAFRRSLLCGLYVVAALLASSQIACADEMSAILGPASGPGNEVTVLQQGNQNNASIEQQAILGVHANVAGISQNGAGNTTSLNQSGGGNGASINQSGNYNSAGITQPGGAAASVSQNGNYLGVQINQGIGASIGVTQFGTGTGAPLVIKQY